MGHKDLHLSATVRVGSPPKHQTNLVVFCLIILSSSIKQSVNNSVPAITPTCTSHSDHLIRSCQCVMLQNVKFLYILFSPSIFRPDIRHLFSSFSVGQTAGIELW